MARFIQQSITWLVVLYTSAGKIMLHAEISQAHLHLQIHRQILKVLAVKVVNLKHDFQIYQEVTSKVNTRVLTW